MIIITLHATNLLQNVTFIINRKNSSYIAVAIAVDDVVDCSCSCSMCCSLPIAVWLLHYCCQ